MKNDSIPFTRMLVDQDRNGIQNRWTGFNVLLVDLPSVPILIPTLQRIEITLRSRFIAINTMRNPFMQLLYYNIGGF